MSRVIQSRQGNLATADPRSRDQALGRLVGEAVEMQGDGTPPPTEEV